MGYTKMSQFSEAPSIKIVSQSLYKLNEPEYLLQEDEYWLSLDIFYKESTLISKLVDEAYNEYIKKIQERSYGGVRPVHTEDKASNSKVIIGLKKKLTNNFYDNEAGYACIVGSGPGRDKQLITDELKFYVFNYTHRLIVKGKLVNSEINVNMDNLNIN